MRRDVISGTLLILGALTGVFALGLHPTAHDLLEPEGLSRMAQLNALVHGTAIAGVPMVFVGLLGLARRLAPSELTTPALVTFATGGVAVVCAAVMSGFVATPVIARIVAADPATRVTYEALLTYTSLLNQGFAKVFVVASSVAIVLWSVAILRSGRLQRAAGIAGAVVGGLVLIAFLTRQVRLDIHGFGLITFAQSAWLIWIGVLLLRRAPPGAAAP